MNLKIEYEQDFHAWIQHNVALLKQGQLSQADIANIIEELDGMGISQKHELKSWLRVLIMHLLKWQFQPTHRSNSWNSTILYQRQEILDILEESPSLKSLLLTFANKVYLHALEGAAGETGLPESTFPQTCPYTIEQLLEKKFLP